MPEDNAYVFTVCPAELTFHNVFNLKFQLDYKTPTAGMCPISIHDIHRESLEFTTEYKTFRWSMPINWPHGSLEFEGPAFAPQLVGTPVARTAKGSGHAL